MPLNVNSDLLVNTVRPLEHSAQLLAILQRVEVDASRIYCMAQSGEYTVEQVEELKRDIQHDLELVNARLVFACNDLQSAARGIPIPVGDEAEDAFGE